MRIEAVHRIAVGRHAKSPARTNEDCTVLAGCDQCGRRAP